MTQTTQGTSRPHRWAFIFRGELWRHPDFLKYWAGWSVSALGKQVTTIALPTAAILLLNAGPAEMGMLTILEYLPFLLLAMVAGVLVDRPPRRTVLVICGAGRSAIFMFVTAAYFIGTLSIYHLYGAALLLGTFSVASQVASQAYQRVLLARSQLMEGNTKREVSGSAASAAGPALAGALIEWIKSAPALLFDATMSLISVAILLTIRTAEPPSSMSGGQGLRTLWGELVQGLRALLGNVILVLFTGNSAQINLAVRIVLTVYLLYAYNELELTPAAVGIALSIGSIGGFLGAFATPPLVQRIGMGPALALASGFVLAGYLMLPLAKFGYAAPLLATASVVFSFCANMHDIIMNTVRQAIVPQQLQGRVVGVARTVTRGMHPLGAAIGGLLGTHVGLAPTVLIGAVLGLLSVLWLLPSPAWHVGRHIALEGK
ncbi:MAG: MFS transporter [Chloroflexota bacterium]|nr:MFS transporter [Chloroflexota bacterium]